MGGSSKPADPKVTPFVEPAPPSNPIPNFFGARQDSGYKPDFGASKASFGAPEQKPITFDAPAPMQMPAMQPAMPAQQQMGNLPPMPSMGMAGGNMEQFGNMMPFSIPTRQPGMGLTLQDGAARAAQNAQPAFDPQNLISRFQANPNMFMDMLGQFRNSFQSAAPRIGELQPFMPEPRRPAIRPEGQPFGINPDDWRA